MRFRVRPPKNRELPLQLKAVMCVTGNKVMSLFIQKICAHLDTAYAACSCRISILVSALAVLGLWFDAYPL